MKTDLAPAGFLRGALHAGVLGIVAIGCGYNPTYLNSQCATQEPMCPAGFFCDTSQVPKPRCVRIANDASAMDQVDGDAPVGVGGNSVPVGSGGLQGNGGAVGATAVTVGSGGSGTAGAGGRTGDAGGAIGSGGQSGGSSGALGAGGRSTGINGGTTGIGGAPAAGGTAATGTGGAGTGGATPTCPVDRVCVDPVPGGWTGPVAVRDADGGGTAPVCDGDFGINSTVLHAGLNAPAAQCGCTCGAPKAGDVYCGQAHIEYFADGACSGASIYTAAYWPNGVSSCFAANVSFVHEAARMTSVDVVVAANATCAATAGKTVAPPSWAQTTSACAPSVQATACLKDKLCLKRASTTFNQGVCIYQTGDIACPAGAYDKRLVRFAGAADTRDCSACSCTRPTGATCLPSFALSDSAADPSCQMGKLVGANGQCVPISITGSGQFKYNGTIVGGTCTPSGGSPTGTAAMTGPVTFCCDAR